MCTCVCLATYHEVFLDLHLARDDAELLLPLDALPQLRVLLTALLLQVLQQRSAKRQTLRFSHNHTNMSALITHTHTHTFTNQSRLTPLPWLTRRHTRTHICTNPRPMPPRPTSTYIATRSHPVVTHAPPLLRDPPPPLTRDTHIPLTTHTHAHTHPHAPPSLRGRPAPPARRSSESRGSDGCTRGRPAPGACRSSAPRRTPALKNRKHVVKCKFPIN